MSLIKLDFLIDEFPGELDAIERLEKFIFEISKRTNGTRDVTPSHMFDVVKPSSQRVLVKILKRIAGYGYVRKILRVNSVMKGGIGDFDSILEIPEVMMDTRLGYEIEVQPEQINLIYQFQITQSLVGLIN
jgi:hypothetical protein